MINNVTNETSFQPTPAMQLWLDKSKELMTNNISEISIACNISRQTWYRWWQEEDFKVWFNHGWASYIKFSGWQLDLIGIRKAETDYRYWAYMQEKISKLNDLTGISLASKVEFIMADKLQITKSY